jgi:putative endopeptidase
MSARRSASTFFLVSALLAVVPALAVQAKEKPLDPANMDLSVRPGDDFFLYANGAWLKANPIPADQTEWGGFVQLIEHNSTVLHGILEDAAKKKGAPKGSPEQLAGDLYASAMDSVRADKEGAHPLDGELAKIAAIQSKDALLDEFARLQARGLRVPFGLGVNQDAKNSTVMMIQLGQSGLGLPDRDYYLKTDAPSQKIRDQYVSHVTRMFKLLGDSDADAAAHAATVVQVETRLANASMTRVQRRDPEATYHKMTLDTLAALTPAISWTRLYTGMGITDTSPVNVAQPAFFSEVNAMVDAVPLPDWQTYLRWHVVHISAPALSSNFVDENFDFFGKTLSGVTAMQPRWKRARGVVDDNVGEALGQLYVAQAFPPAAKERARKMVEDLRAELRDRIDKLAWMSPETKAQAQKKLAAFGVKIGYPDTWRDYSALTIDRGPLLDNVLRARQFEFNRNLAKLGKPVDRKEWGMTPPTVNAYYNSRRNEIVFPAGILQPPFFNANADDAVNYGGMGAVIGHEMTHGFDDQGRKSDADGNLKDWWTPADAAEYTKRATLVQEQFDGFVAVDSMHVNGKLTLGEDLADLGGLNVAYGALQRALAGKPRTKIDGFTPEQRFFLSFAQIWRENIRPEALKLQLNTDPHAPGHFRANAPLQNMPEFAEAFGVMPGEPMVRPAELQAKIW